MIVNSTRVSGLSQGGGGGPPDVSYRGLNNKEYMQSVLTISASHAKCPILFSALYAKCLYYIVLYMQSVHSVYCFICKVSIVCTALYAE